MKTRTLLLSASVLVLLASPAAARNGAWYVGGDFGGMIVDDVKLDFPAGSGQLFVNHDYGYDGALFVGYDLGAFRVEAEASYKRAGVQDIESSIALLPVLPISSTDFPGTGRTSALSFMVNGMLDFGDDDGVSGFIGPGIGVSRVKFDYGRDIPPFVQVADGSDTVFAWQIMVGLRQAITDNIDVTLRYRFFNTDSIRVVDFRGSESEGRFRSHSLLGGITFNFGAAPPPPPPPPPPSPPATETPAETPR